MQLEVNYMNWFDNFMEKARIPAIGTPEWLQCIPVNEREVARMLVSESVRVGVVPMSGIWKIVFDETEFAAGVFSDQAAADEFATNWNKSVASSLDH
jgi:hypothetical protein